MGRNRHGHPLPIRLFRPEPTRAMLVGGLRCTQLLAFRALAVGARVLVRTYRPREWAPFARGTATPDGSIVLAPPDHPIELPPGSPLRPLLTILDLRPTAAPSPGSTTRPSGVYDVRPLPAAGTDPEPTRKQTLPGGGSAAIEGQDLTGGAVPVRGRGAADGGTALARAVGRGVGRPWEATLTVRDEFGGADVATAVGADLVLLQPLRVEAAELIGAALGLGDVARLLARMRPGMVGVVNRQVVRWATLSPTSVEKVLIGDPSRSAGES